MLQIPPHILFSKSNSYEKLAGNYLPGMVGPEAFSPEIMYRLQQLAGTTINDEKFFFVTDVKTGAISHCNGISQCLGYTDNHFTQKNYLHILHPAHAVVQGFYAAAFFRLLSLCNVGKNIMQPFSSSTLALKSKAGKYLFCKRRCFPLQLTMHNQLATCLCEFTVVKNHTTEEYYTHLYDAAFTQHGATATLLEYVKEVFRDIPGGFSMQEHRIMSRYAQYENSTSETIANAFKIEKATVNTYNKRIMKKTETLFAKRVGSAREAAAYFKTVQLI